MDSSESPTHGEQEGSAYNGHFACTCYHPLFVFNQFGDVERCTLRPGNVHSADGWRALLEPVIARYRGIVKHLYFRGDAAFANPGVYELLEAEGASYTIRLPANPVLQDKIGHLLTPNVVGVESGADVVYRDRSLVVEQDHDYAPSQEIQQRKRRVGSEYWKLETGL